MPEERTDSEDLRIGQLLNDFLDRKQRGEPVSEQEFLAAHPECAEDLRALGMVCEAVPGLSQVGPGMGKAANLPADALPGYEILGEIHRGGQGVVYQALQRTTRRQVAIKVMREGPFAGWRDRARFEREVQVLGALRHPNIVTIHDSGTAAGCHFFVMDYIAGTPLDAWAGTASPSVKATLELFLRICDAVNAAHVKGIVHRDLKPGNICIDEQGQPHILDFGLAKVTHDDDEPGGSSSMTQVGQFVGSLPWTSPEQAQGLLDQIDMRTDVYALGVTLYHLLTGQFPYQVVGPVRDVLNRIVADEPARPAALRKGIDKDVEAIVLKCLRKEAPRRYQTAGELGRDIERYLNNEPIAARSDSGLYVVRKMLRRYRVPVAVAAAFAMLVGVSLLGSVSLWRQAVAQRNRADTEAREANNARKIAETERARAQEQAEQLRRTGYLNRMALAQNAYEQKYLTQVRRLLSECPQDLRGWEWLYLSRLSSQPTILSIGADSDCVLAIAVAEEGRRVATAGCDGTIRIWDGATGAAIGELKGHAGQVNGLAFSLDGRWIASAGRDRTLRLWDARHGGYRILQEDKEYTHCVAFSPDAKYLVSGGQGRVLNFWDVASGQLVRTTPPHQGEVSCVAYRPDGKSVATGEFMDLFSKQSRIRIWDAETGGLLREMPGHSAGILSIAYSPDGRHIASGSSIPAASRDALGTLKIFDGETGTELFSLRGHEGSVDGLAFSPEGEFLASAGNARTPAFGMESDRTLKVWDAATGAELSTYSAHGGGGRAVAWGADATRIYSGGMDGRLKVWPNPPPSDTRILQGHSGPVLRIAFSPDGKRLVSGGGESGRTLATSTAPADPIRVWDLESGSQVLTLSGHPRAVLDLAWSPDGKRIASGGMDATLRIWDSSNGTQEQQVGNPEGLVHAVAFSPDGSLLAGAAGATVTIWNTSDWAQQWQARHDDTVVVLAFSPDGQRVAAGSQDGVTRVYESRSGAEIGTISTGSAVVSASFSPDSQMLATAHADGSIVLWDMFTGTRIATMGGPARSVQWIDFSPNGQRIASCGTDMMLKVWDVRSAGEVYASRAHNAAVSCVRFSPDGRTIATCGQDGLIKLWETGNPATSQASGN